MRDVPIDPFKSFTSAEKSPDRVIGLRLRLRSLPDRRPETVDDEDFTLQIEIISFLMAFIVTFFSNLIITHRFVGPFVAINRYGEALIKNKFDEPLNLRTSDEMHEIAGKLKTLDEKLKNKKLIIFFDLHYYQRQVFLF